VVAVTREPELARLVEVVARAVVDDEERLAATAAHDLLEEVEECACVEYRLQRTSAASERQRIHRPHSGQPSACCATRSHRDVPCAASSKVNYDAERTNADHADRYCSIAVCQKGCGPAP